MNTMVKVIVGIFIALGVGFIVYQVGGQWHRKQLVTALNNQKEQHQREVAQLEGQLMETRAKLNQIEQAEAANRAEPPVETLQTIFGEKTPAQSLGQPDVDCAQLTLQTKDLFAYIDKQGYLAQGGITTQFEPFFQECIKLLSEKPPVLVAEMDDLFLLAKNVSHIYRVLGLNRIKVLKNIIEQESDVLEPSMAVLFSWINVCRKNEAGATVMPQLKSMYEYAGFFLNTLGGRSYLLRRDSKVRMLVNYYSLQILDLANDEKQNPVGIDIRPYLETQFVEMSSHKGLVYRDRYLAELKKLQAKYEHP